MSKKKETDNDFQIEVNILKREDANDKEWALAKTLETILSAAMVGAAKKIYNFKDITGGT